MKSSKPLMKSAIALASASLGIAALTTAAWSETCSNTCVTVAIPRAEGVETKLDGSADAVLWPPSKDLRTIQISALNDRNSACDVTIQDVLQDEKPATSAGGAPIDDAVGCVNDGEESTIQLRSDRDRDGNGRSYHVMVSLADPDCTSAAKGDEIVIDVPRTQTTDLQPDPDVNNLVPSYRGDALACVPEEPDRVAAVPR